MGHVLIIQCACNDYDCFHFVNDNIDKINGCELKTKYFVHVDEAEKTIKDFRSSFVTDKNMYTPIPDFIWHLLLGGVVSYYHD